MSCYWENRIISHRIPTLHRYICGTCKPLTLVRIPAQYLQTPVTSQGTCMLPANPYHWSEHLHGTSKPLTLIRIPTWYQKTLPLIRTPAGYLRASDTGQDTCVVPANPWHWWENLHGICKLLTRVRIPAWYLHTLTLVRILAWYLQTPNAGQDTGVVPANSWHWSGYEKRIKTMSGDSPILCCSAYGYLVTLSY